MNTETIQLVIVALLIVGIFVALALDWASPDIVAMAGLVTVVVFEILRPGETLLVFSNSAPIIIGTMFILSVAMNRTSVIDHIGKAFLRLDVRRQCLFRHTYWISNQYIRLWRGCLQVHRLSSGGSFTERSTIDRRHCIYSMAISFPTAELRLGRHPFSQ